MKTITIHIAKFLPAFIMLIRANFFRSKIKSTSTGSVNKDEKKTEPILKSKLPKKMMIETNFRKLSNIQLIQLTENVMQQMTISNCYIPSHLKYLETISVFSNFHVCYMSCKYDSEAKLELPAHRKKLIEHLTLIAKMVKHHAELDAANAAHILTTSGFEVN